MMDSTERIVKAIERRRSLANLRAAVQVTLLMLALGALAHYQAGGMVWMLFGPVVVLGVFCIVAIYGGSRSDRDRT